MRKNIYSLLFGLVLMTGSATVSIAQVTRVEMHINGRLRGSQVSNVQRAVSRLDFAPKQKEIQITDIQKGIGVFTPKPDKPVSFAALKETLKKAGYVMDTAKIVVRGNLTKDAEGWSIIAPLSGQRFL